MQSVEGDIGEVGVFRGDSARVICEVKGSKSVFLCDTFEGMPDEMVDERKDTWKKATHRRTSVEDVRQYLADFDNVAFVKGIFPQSITDYPDLDLQDRQYSFVHLDVDLYRSTLEALRFFWPRLAFGGRLVSHNYNPRTGREVETAGVKEAFWDYFEDPAALIEIADTQVLVVKGEARIKDG